MRIVYQFMRFDWLEKWQQNQLNTKQPAEQWLAELWRKLIKLNEEQGIFVIGAQGLLNQLNKLKKTPSKHVVMF